MKISWPASLLSVKDRSNEIGRNGIDSLLLPNMSCKSRSGQEQGGLASKVDTYHMSLDSHTLRPVSIAVHSHPPPPGCTSGSEQGGRRHCSHVPLALGIDMSMPFLVQKVFQLRGVGGQRRFRKDS